MSKELYKDKQWLYTHYVTKRMNLVDIAELLKKNYGVTVSSQTIYNWAKKFDLLKYRGKGRKLGQMNKRPDSPMMKRMKEMQRIQRAKMKKKRRK